MPRLVVDRTKNPISNPTFATNTTGWSLDADYTRITIDGYDDSACVNQVSASGFANFNQSGGQTLTRNTNYTLTFARKGTITSGSAPKIYINADSAFGTLLKQADITASASWGLFTVQFNTGDHDQIYIRIFNNNGNVNYSYDYFVIRQDNMLPPIRRKTGIVRTNVPRGAAISGLEFAAGIIPGTIGTNYFASTQATYDYIKSKGFDNVRIAFTWERLQPTMNAAFDTTYKSQLDAEITRAQTAGLNVMLDCHNFGARYVQIPGGFTSNFSSPDPIWSGGTQSGGKLTVDNFTGALAGHPNNPVSPASTYIFSTDLTINSNGGSDLWRAAWIEVFRQNQNNRYFFTMSTLSGGWQFYKVVNGSQTLLASGTYAYATATTYKVKIDVGQTSVGRVLVSHDVGAGYVQIADVAADAALTKGQVGVFPNGVNCSIDNCTLNVAADTTAGMTSGTYTIGTSQVPLSSWSDFCLRLSQAYKANSAVFAYDVMNEPHDMAVPTTSSNYNTTSSVTLMLQAAINAIRSNGDNKWIICEIDQYAGGQNFTANYGTNPTPWLTDAANRIVYSFHYYFDSDHSGSYPNGFDSNTYFTRLESDLLPIMQWAKLKNVRLHCGEFGTPNNDTRWLDCLEKFLNMCDEYNVWANHWAMGDAYIGPATSMQPTNNVDTKQMWVVGRHLGVAIP